MTHFPQLESGCSGQYPITRKLSLRTYSSETPGGNRRAAFDAGGSTVIWRMPLAGLSETEAAAIEILYQQCEGRRLSFMFIDPSANLLAGTDDVAGTLWEKGPGIVVAGGVMGPEGQAGAFIVTNGGAGWSGVSQSLAIPETMNYCLSAWVRSEGGSRAKLSIGGVEREVETGSEWRQAWVSGASGTGPVQFAIAAPAGGAIEVYGPQAEAQIAPSEYKRNRGRGGWYARARFDTDELNLEAEAPGLYACEVAIVSPWEE